MSSRFPRCRRRRTIPLGERRAKRFAPQCCYVCTRRVPSFPTFTLELRRADRELTLAAIFGNYKPGKLDGTREWRRSA